jgi:hypothetical protein
VALNGAEGQTRQQMLDSLSLSGSALEAVNTANAQLIKVIGTPAKNITLGNQFVLSRIRYSRAPHQQALEGLGSCSDEKGRTDVQFPLAKGRVSGRAASKVAD